MRRLLNFFEESSFCGLLMKETMQTLRDRHLLFLLVFPPTIQLLLLGAALDPGVHDIRLGVCDNSRTEQSRALVSSVGTGNVFHLQETVNTEGVLEKDLACGKIKAALIIPSSFERDLSMSHMSEVQVLIDGTDAYSARIAAGKIAQVVREFNGEGGARQPLIQPVVTTLYNPDLLSSWYFIPGVMGAVLTLTSTLVSSAVLLREKECGTLEQLLMTPYSVFEILLAKVLPIFVLLMGDACLAVLTGMLVFGVPFRGSPLLFWTAAALYICVGMGLGMMLATVCRTERQAHLVSFFVNIPVMQLSGAVVPFETMPDILRGIGTINPLRYFTIIARSLLLKGADYETLSSSLLVLFVSAVVLFSFSLWRFRKQLT